MNDSSTQTLDAALAALASDDAETRLQARATLVSMAEEAVPRLLEMIDRGGREGHEARVVLASCPTEEALDALHRGLSAEDPEVRWLSAEGLARLGLPAVERVLHDLTDADLDEATRRSAHHVLGAQRGRAMRTLLRPVLRAFTHDMDRIEVARHAFEVLDALRHSH